MAEVIIETNNAGFGGDVEKIESAVVKMQKTLSWLLTELDSSNITAINTNITNIKSDDGTTEVNGSQIVMKDADGRLRAKLGHNKENGNFEFIIYNQSGQAVIYEDSEGDAVFGGQIDVATDIRAGNNIYLGDSENGNGVPKTLQFFSDEENDIKRVRLVAEKAPDGWAELSIIAPKIKIHTLDGFVDTNGNSYITRGTSMKVTINGIDYPVTFN